MAASIAGPIRLTRRRPGCPRTSYLNCDRSRPSAAHAFRRRTQRCRASACQLPSLAMQADPLRRRERSARPFVRRSRSHCCHSTEQTARSCPHCEAPLPKRLRPQPGTGSFLKTLAERPPPISCRRRRSTRRFVQTWGSAVECLRVSTWELILAPQHPVRFRLWAALHRQHLDLDWGCRSQIVGLHILGRRRAPIGKLFESCIHYL